MMGGRTGLSSLVNHVLSLIVLALFGGGNHDGVVVVDGFHIGMPGLHPHSYTEGEPVKLKVNKLTSTHTQLPLDYYKFPFCAPANGPEMENENLGEFLAGDRIQSSPYLLYMKNDMYCEHLCKSHLGRKTELTQNNNKFGMMGKSAGAGAPGGGNQFRPKQSSNKIIRAIARGYHNNWIVDNLNSASKAENDEKVMTNYYQGFPIGYVSWENRKVYVNNHVNIEIMYHRDETDLSGDSYRIVRFTVEPFSIAHDADFTQPDDAPEDQFLPLVAKINNPIPSCDPGIKKKDPETHHTNYDMITDTSHEPQEAWGSVLFTYDVIWIENTKINWASRWDVYLKTKTSPQVHWESILFSLVLCLILSGMIGLILVRNLRRDLARYNKLATDEEKEEELEEFGWKLVHADVFRPPQFSPKTLSVFCGTGAQLLCMVFLTIFFSVLGFISPKKRGVLLTTELVLFVLMGSVGGYVSGWVYKTLGGKSFESAAIYTAFFFPGISFLFFFVLNVVAWVRESTDAVPFTTMLILLLLWFGISTPLVYFGGFLGFKANPMEFPVHTSQIARQVPEQPWFMSGVYIVLLGGVLPFGSCFVEMFFILQSIWMEYYYYVFGFLFFVFAILLLTCAEITILFTYYQLCGEDYHWWWRSFFIGGSTGVYIFFYSIVFFAGLEANVPATYFLYFGYMCLVSFAMFLLLGFVGFMSTLYFNKMIFGSIKID